MEMYHYMVFSISGKMSINAGAASTAAVIHDGMSHSLGAEEQEVINNR